VKRGDVKKVVQSIIKGVPVVERFYEYDCEGRQVEEKIYIKGAYIQKTTYAYDVNGRMSGRAIYLEDGSIEMSERYEREYDRYGNWIKKTGYHWMHTIEQSGSGVSTTLTKRIITYY
jgi:hypothetical protein